MSEEHKNTHYFIRKLTLKKDETHKKYKAPYCLNRTIQKKQQKAPIHYQSTARPSILYSWCTLSHLSGETLLMAK